jgi:hypothetical protein
MSTSAAVSSADSLKSAGQVRDERSASVADLDVSRGSSEAPVVMRSYFSIADEEKRTPTSNQ